MVCSPARRRRSIRRTTSASKPYPALKVNQRSSASPSPIRRPRPARSASRIAPVASNGCTGSPSARTKTLVEPPGTTASAGSPGRGPVGEQPVHDLVDGAVAAEGDDQVEPLPRGADGERGGVAAVAGLHHLDLQLAGQRPREHLAAAGGRRGGGGVHHQEGAHRSSLRRSAGWAARAGTLPAVPEQEQPRAPRAVRLAALLVAVEGAALVVLAGVEAVSTLVSGASSVPLALVTAASAAGCGVFLVWLARSLGALRKWARSPVVVVQLIALPVGYNLINPSGRPELGVPVLALAVATLVLLGTAGARAALDRS